MLVHIFSSLEDLAGTVADMIALGRRQAELNKLLLARIEELEARL
jgi:hypothetical protein